LHRVGGQNRFFRGSKGKGNFQRVGGGESPKRGEETLKKKKRSRIPQYTMIEEEREKGLDQNRKRFTVGAPAWGKSEEFNREKCQPLHPQKKKSTGETAVAGKLAEKGGGLGKGREKKVKKKGGDEHSIEREKRAKRKKRSTRRKKKDVKEIKEKPEETVGTKGRGNHVCRRGKGGSRKKGQQLWPRGEAG